MGWVLIFLVVRLSTPRNDRLAFARSTDSLALPLSRVRRVPASRRARTSSTAPGLPALLEQIGDLVPDLGHPPGDGLLLAAPQSTAPAPASEGGLLRISSSSSFCARLSFAAFSLPA